jgi:transposase
MEDKQIFTKILGIHLPWYIDRVEIDEKAERVDVFIDHEAGIRVACPECGKFYGLYDHAPERIFRHLNVCQMATYIHVRPPRVSCPDHGVKQIGSEFGENGSDMTYAFERHVIDVAHECSIEAVGRICGITWDRGWNAFDRAVSRGLSRKEHRIPRRMGIDEKSFARGHKYESLVYDIDRSTVEYVGDDREQESLEKYYRQFTPEELATVEAVAMDMWDPYIAATKRYIPDAEKKIVFDRFHVMRFVVDGVDKVRKEEHKTRLAEGDSTLKGTKYLWLWSKEHMPEYRVAEFRKLQSLDLKVSRAWAIKENLRNLWNYVYEKCMRNYFQNWYWWATHSRLQPMIDAAKTLHRHLANIVTYSKHRITNALGESLNSKIEKVKRMACGFRNREHYKIAIFFHCGGLDLYPIPPANPTMAFRTC